jgi:hypothetical protein
VRHTACRCSPTRPAAWIHSTTSSAIAAGSAPCRRSTSSAARAWRLRWGRGSGAGMWWKILNRSVRQRGALRVLFADKGAACTSQLVHLQACHHGVRIGCPSPGKPTDNASKDTSDATLRDEGHCFGVPVPGRRPGPDRGLDNPLQRGATHSAPGSLTSKAAASQTQPAQQFA